MSMITLLFADSSVKLDCREISGTERLGEASTFEISAFAAEPVAAAAVLGQACAIVVQTPHGARAMRGKVTRFVAIATAQERTERRYRLVVRSSIALLGLRRPSRVFQHLSVPDVVKKVLEDAGFSPEAFKASLKETHAEREYLVQYAETDLAFIRRICEEEGLYFRCPAEGEDELFVLEDTSAAVAPALDGPLTVVEDRNLLVGELLAYDVVAHRRRRAGKVTLRDYDPAKPALKLEGVAEGGTSLEKETEVYAAPGRFRDESAGKRRARLHLESLRASASTITLRTTAAQLAPGDAFDLECAPDYSGSARPEGTHFTIAVTHKWAFGDGKYHVSIEAIASEIPYRLPRVTPRPRIAGIHSATVTGPPGQEIHPDKEGRVFVRFDWDRDGPKDDKSSLPVRVAQPNTPGSMTIPRVGWEMFVVFEDGDPDRPYVLGRAHNAKTPPSFPLPANKTVTALKTHSSPGGGKSNSIHFDDAAGRQHLQIGASFGKTTTVANNMFTQTTKVEIQNVTGSQSRTIGGKEDVSVTESFIVAVGSQTATVGAMQSLYVAKNQSVGVGSEAVVIGGALLEKVGNPVTGLTNLAKAAALAGAGALGGRLAESAGRFRGVAAMASSAVVTGAGIGMAMYDAANAPGAGPDAARNAGIRGLLGAGAGMIPGGDALFASASGMGLRFPWEPAPPGGGAAAAGGGAAAASDAAAAAGPGPGHRKTLVKGAMMEAIGSSLAVVTPGSIKWQTTGASLIGVGASHSTKAVAVASKVLGASIETLGSLSVDVATTWGQEAKGAVKTTIGGSLTSNATGQHSITAPSSVTIKVGGSATFDGAIVAFVVGSSVVAASSSGVLIKAGTITIKGKTKQSGKATHS